MVSSTLLVFLVGVAIRGVVSQDITTSPNTTETTSATTSPSGSAVSGESADEKSCSYDGSVTDYLKCQKDNVSSGTLIAAGIGVTVGVLAIVGIGVWMCQRKRRTVPKPTTSTKTQPARRTRSKRDEEEAAGYDSEDEYLSDPIPPVPNKSSMNRATDAAREKGQFVTASHRDVRARVDSVSGSETEEIMRKHGGPPPPHPAHQINPSLQRGVPVQPTGQPRQIDPRPAVQLPSQLVGSPVDAESNPRNLYPSNPSPTPRHMRPQPPMTSRPASAMRQSVYSKRQSVVSVRKSPPIGNTAVPPLPPIHALRQDSSPPAGQTRPLLIRKSTLPQGASSLPYNSPPTAKPSEIRPIPSYLEATNAPTPQRRPSEGPKRGSEERGGMI